MKKTNLLKTYQSQMNGKKEDFQGRLEASATFDISINFSGSEKIYFYLF